MGFKETGGSIKKSYEVIEEVASVGVFDDGWELKIRLISWFGNDAKYDIRRWKNEDGVEKCSKGLTLTGEEIMKLAEVLGEIAQEGED